MVYQSTWSVTLGGRWCRGVGSTCDGWRRIGPGWWARGQGALVVGGWVGGWRGDSGQGESNPIAKNCRKSRENCGAVTKPPAASRSNTSAPEDTRGTDKRARGTCKKQLRKIAAHCGKLREIVGKLRKIANNCRPQSPPPRHWWWGWGWAPPATASNQRGMDRGTKISVLLAFR